MKRLELIGEAVSQPALSVDNLQTLKIEEREKGVATVWFNKEASFNSISMRMAQQFGVVFSALDNDPSIKIILIRSRHQRIFSGGADLKDIFLNPEAKNHASSFIGLSRTFRQVRKPLIAIVQGLALGGGFEVALICDLILCSEKAKFQLPEINLGIIPGMGGTQHMARLAGTKIAMEKVMTGLPLTAAQAHQLNIATCFPSENFEQKVTEFIDKLVNKASSSLEAAKQAINSSQETSLEQGRQLETALFSGLFKSEGAKEGLSAFMEKRKPEFRSI